MRQIPVSFYVISKKKEERLVVAICPRTGLHDQRVKTIRDSYQRGEHEGATSLRPGKQHRWQLHLITTRPGAGKVKQGAAECADPGYGREL